jgi:N-hydroxyarylamine O-acetyltransferase
VGLTARAADGETLRAMHAAHRQAFLFENLTIQSGGRISLAVCDLERKFLDEGRGGYCFEHNTLFAAALRAVGFDPVTLLGRVRRGPPERRARTHMVLRIAAGDAGRPFLADVGFGAIGIVEPIPLEDGAVATQRGLTYRLRRETGLWVLSSTDSSGETDLYEFSEDPQTAGDVVVANHYTSTHPESMFRRTLTIQSISAGERIILRTGTLTRWRGAEVSEEAIDRARLPALARELFGVELPDQPLVSDAAEPA